MEGDTADVHHVASTPCPAARALFITHVDPALFRSRNSGIQQRFELLLAGLAEIAQCIDFAILTRDVEPETQAARKAEAVAQLQLRTRRPVTVTLIPLGHDQSHEEGLWRRYVTSSSSLCRLPGYRAYVGTPQVQALEAIVRKGHHDCLLVQRLCCAAALMRFPNTLKLPPIFFDLDDIEHVAYRRLIEQPPHWGSKRLGYLHLPALLLGERRAIRMAKKTFVCSDADRRRLRRTLRVNNVDVVPNGVVMPARVTPPARAPRLLFVGIYGYAPNRVAADFFLDHIWPCIRAGVPTAQVLFVGARVEALSHYAAPPDGVEFAGFVKDLEPCYERTRIVVCPLLSGGGTRVKIIEAAAHARAVVSTPIGAEGLEFRNGREMVLAADAATFAAACIRLLDDYDTCRSIGLAARERAETLYRRDSISRRLAGYLREGIEHAAANLTGA